MYVGPWQEYALTRLWAAAVRAQKKKEADEKQVKIIFHTSRRILLSGSVVAG